MKNDIINFNFNGGEVGFWLDENGNPYVVGSHLCQVLDIQDAPQAMARLDDDQKLLRVLHVAGQKRTVWVANESGIYTLILRSNKPEAKKFRRWITDEVLPALRKTGAYSTKGRKRPLTPEEIAEIEEDRKIERVMKAHRMMSAQLRAAKQAGIPVKIARRGAAELVLDTTGVDYTAMVGEAEDAEEVEAYFGPPSQTISDFVTEWCELGGTDRHRVPAPDLFDAYMRWAHLFHRSTLGRNNFYQALVKGYQTIRRGKLAFGETRAIGFTGIRLLDERAPARDKAVTP